ncbi:phosphoadenylyl-sulfate reductase [Rubrivivax rivuli]|uniref:Adenosine 5'-phosphosulfate reductase n=1 Tax=Rubrivivax rivuli TaxID=1862385 RepID=A0A437RH08_9BURK|nr:phosphoadenylyl-sulfate reductase [Rubrivivax rivuli]RVU46050.1 phosphoadenylyl-sulfate reductase [Rubrivivax rivuli]
MSRAIELYARATPGHEERVAETAALLRSAADRHAGRIVFTTSLGAEDMVLTALIAQHRLPIALATLQTGRLHAQTLALMDQTEAQYGLAIERWEPAAEAVISFTRQHGELPMRQSIELRKACCGLRKVEPLSRALAGRTAWVTGLRREQSDARAELPVSSVDEHGREKLNPLAAWSQTDVWHFIAHHGVPYNPLHDAFYPSIGCEPCTRAVALGEDIRAGRWWWEQEDAKECGLHVSTVSAAPAAFNKETA